MSQLNLIQIIGYLGRDPEMKYFQDGTPICSFSVGVDDSYTDRNNQKVDRTQWFNVSIRQKKAEACSRFLRKGSLVYVQGKFTTRMYKDQQGYDKSYSEIQAYTVEFLDRKNQNGQQNGYPAQNPTPQNSQNMNGVDWYYQQYQQQQQQQYQPPQNYQQYQPPVQQQYQAPVQQQYQTPIAPPLPDQNQFPAMSQAQQFAQDQNSTQIQTPDPAQAQPTQGQINDNLPF